MIRRLVVLLLVGLAFGPARAGLAAQEVNVASRGPRFLVAGSAQRLSADAREAAVLRRRVTLGLERVSLDRALKEITAQAGLQMTYSGTAVPVDRPVSLQAKNITVAAALTELLFDLNIDVSVTTNGHLALVRRAATAVVAPGTVVGRVTDAKTGDALVGAEVFLEGARARATTGDKGYYKLTDVEAGTYTLTVRRVGYAKRSRTVTVTAGQELTVDVALQSVVTQLNELVTTVTGEQRVRELGHVVSRINADSLVKEAPINSLSDLLAARVPGLQVFTPSGQVGGKVTLQVRTPNSLFLNNEPIIIVDGVRYANNKTNRSGPFGSEETSRLNDLNPNDIASVEVVKGPSAATLYGTDAANGVLVITTKRGRGGPAEWNAFMRTTRLSVPKFDYPVTYWGWNSQYPDYSCQLGATWCTQDSVTQIKNPLVDPDLTVLKPKPGWEYGGTLSGGRQDLRYYISGGYERATGAVSLPKDAIERLKTQRGVKELPDELLDPNAEHRVMLRSNVTIGMSTNSELQINTGYGRTAARTISGFSGVFRSTPADPYGSSSYDPANNFAATSTETNDRFNGGATGQWRPFPWAQGRATVGVDFGSAARYSIAYPGQYNGEIQGLVGEDRTQRLGITGDVSLSALARYQRLSFRTAVGAQYARQRTNVLINQGRNLPPGAKSVRQASSKYIDQSYTETTTLGSYLEESVGFNDRLYLTGAVRLDGASNFGADYNVATYPKISASWIVSDEPFMPRVPGLEELRLRYAYGASGQQAFSYMTLPFYYVTSQYVNGAFVSTIQVTGPGNPDLRPERTKEHEGGLDATGFNGRVKLGLTWYKRRTSDQLVNRPTSLGFGTIYRNLGLLSAHGFEAEVTLRPIETPLLSWQVMLQHSLRRTRVEKLGGVSESKYSGGGYVEGYPLGARFASTLLGFNDANGDGIITPNEVQVSTDPLYVGESTPPETQNFTTVFGLFRERLRLSALFQRQNGYTQVNRVSADALARVLVDPSTPLEIQAMAWAPFANYRYANVESGKYVRLQEVSVSADLPMSIVRALRVRSASFSLSGRNLALWSKFSGPDPASASVSSSAGGFADNLPQSRTWVARFDLGL